MSEWDIDDILALVFWLFTLFFIVVVIYGGHLFLVGIVAWVSAKIDLAHWQKVALYAFLVSFFILPVVIRILENKHQEKDQDE